MAVQIVNNRIDGLRVTIFDVLHYLEAGRSPEEIVDILPLTLEQVEAAIRHIQDHQKRVLAVHRSIEARIGRGNPPEILARAEAGRLRMEEVRRAKETTELRNGDREGTPGRCQ